MGNLCYLNWLFFMYVTNPSFVLDNIPKMRQALKHLFCHERIINNGHPKIGKQWGSKSASTGCAFYCFCSITKKVSVIKSH